MVSGQFKSCGSGSAENSLSPDELVAILEAALGEIGPEKRVLAIIPDKTRDDNTHQLLPAAASILARQNIAKFDILVAQGTHAPMNDAEKLAKLGVTDFCEIAGLGKIFDHEWDVPDEIISLGTLHPEKVAELTGGLLVSSINITVNRLISHELYDHILVFGGCSPHEVAGYAGGAKYFFPGVSGAELTNATHWLGALAGIENTIGLVETPVRRLIEAAVDLIDPEIICFTSVCSRTEGGSLETHAFFAGDIRDSFRKAADVSREVHIRFTGRKYNRIVALLDDHYDELWTGGKASYKLGGIIENGGELIIYAPHLRRSSTTHGEIIEKYGYAPIEKVKQMVGKSAELRANLCVAAHLAHVAYAGTAESGGFEPRFHISLASQIDRITCDKLNLSYLDLNKFSLSEYSGDADTLIVDRAGQVLYLVD